MGNRASPKAAGLSETAMAVFAFAAYHQLTSGQRVTAVAARDGAGRRAEPDAVAEIEAAGLASRRGDELAFTDAGLAVLDEMVQVIHAIRRIAGPRSASGLDEMVADRPADDVHE